MKSITRFFFILLSLAVLPMAAHAKGDPVVINKINFKSINKNEIQRSDGPWQRIEVIIEAKENPDEKASNPQWVRNVDVGLTLVYKDEKASDKNNPESMVVMQAKAKLFAIQVGKKVPVVFYIPWEAYNVYRLSGDAFAWSVDLSVGGKQIELTKSNLKTMLSKSILKSSDPKQAYESYKALIASASKANEGVLIPFPKAPYNVMFYEFEKGGNSPFPSYITE